MKENSESKNMHHSIRVCYQKFKIVLAKEFLLLIATSWLKEIHTLVSILQNEQGILEILEILVVNSVHFTTVLKT